MQGLMEVPEAFAPTTHKQTNYFLCLTCRKLNTIIKLYHSVATEKRDIMSNATKKNIFVRGIHVFKEEVMTCAEMIDECIHKGTL